MVYRVCAEFIEMCVKKVYMFLGSQNLFEKTLLSQNGCKIFLHLPSWKI